MNLDSEGRLWSVFSKSNPWTYAKAIEQSAIDGKKIAAVHTMGKSVFVLMSDGCILRTDTRVDQIREVGANLFSSIDTWEEEVNEATAKAAEETRERVQKELSERKAREEAERQAKRTALNDEKSKLQTELANLKGLFSGKRRKEIEIRLKEIEIRMKELDLALSRKA